MDTLVGRYAAAMGRDIFDVNALRGKLHQPGSPNLQVSLSGNEISLILKTRWPRRAYL